jgi:hypothetical protein
MSALTDAPTLFVDGRHVRTSNVATCTASGTTVLYMYPLRRMVIGDKNLVVKLGTVHLGASAQKHRDGPYCQTHVPQRHAFPLRWQSDAERVVLELDTVSYAADDAVVGVTGASHYSAFDKEWLGISIEAKAALHGLLCATPLDAACIARAPLISPANAHQPSQLATPY